MKTVLILVLLVLVVGCGARTSQVNASLPGPVAPVVEPALPKSITAFVPDTSPMPDALPWFEAAKSGDHDAQFVVGMMYRDKMPEIEHIVNGHNSPETANYAREATRWLYHTKSTWYVIAFQHEGDDYLDFYFEPNKSIWSYLVYGDLKIGWRDDFYFKLDNSNPIDMGVACTQSASTLKWLETAAAHGYSHAELVLGLAYYKGVCVKADKKRSLELIQRAALHDKTNATACYYTGMMYELGIGQDVDKAQANAWLHLAADNGNRDAQFVLGLKYLDGIDVYADKAKARQYLKASETEESVYQKKQLWSGMLSGTIYEDSYFNKNLFWEYNDDPEFSFRNGRIYLGKGFGLKCETEKLRVEQEEVVSIYRENIHEYDDAGGDGDCCCQGPCGPEYCDDDIERTQEEIELECCDSGPEWCDHDEYRDDYEPSLYNFRDLLGEDKFQQYYEKYVNDKLDKDEKLDEDKLPQDFIDPIVEDCMKEWIEKQMAILPEYVTDYDILNQWLYSVATDNHPNAMMMRNMVLANQSCGGKLMDEELQKWGPDEASARQTVVHQYFDTLRSKQYPNIQHSILNYYLAQKDIVHALELLLETEPDQYIRESSYRIIVILIQNSILSGEKADLISQSTDLLQRLVDKYPQAISIIDNLADIYSDIDTDLLNDTGIQQMNRLLGIRISLYKKALESNPELCKDTCEKIGDIYYVANKYQAYKYYNKASKGLEWTKENAKLLLKKKYLEYIIGKHYYYDGKELNNDDIVIGPDDHMKLYDSEEELQELAKEDSIFRVEPDNRANARKWLERAIEEYDQYRTVDRTKSYYSDYGRIPMMLMRLYGTDVLSKGSLDNTIRPGYGKGCPLFKTCYKIL